MNLTQRFSAGVVFSSLMAASPLLAHHARAGVYDLNTVERATGIVQKSAFTNPHGALHIEITNAKGEAQAADDGLFQRPDRRRRLGHRPESRQVGR